VDDLQELMDGASLPDAEDGDYYTLAGMCMHYFGRIPHAGEFFDWAGWRIEIVDLDGARIDKLLLHRLPEEDADDTTG
jgi:putative hemolysin